MSATNNADFTAGEEKQIKELERICTETMTNVIEEIIGNNENDFNLSEIDVSQTETTTSKNMWRQFNEECHSFIDELNGVKKVDKNHKHTSENKMHGRNNSNDTKNFEEGKN